MTRKSETVVKGTPTIKERGPRIYIGPSFKGVVSGTVYSNDLAPALNEAIKAVPVIAELVVPVSGLVNANKALASADSALNRFYQIAMDYRKGE